jgi:general secretion pathway protein D
MRGSSWNLRASLMPPAMGLLCAGLASCVLPNRSVPDQVVDISKRTTSTSFAALATPATAPGSVALPASKAPSGTVAPIIVQGEEDGPEPVGTINAATSKDAGYVLNFDNADVREVVKAVLKDTLGSSYTIDPAVQGTITLHTAKSLNRAAVLPAFEDALKLAGAALVQSASGYQIVPLQGAAQRGALGSGSALQPGYQIRLIPLGNITTADAQRALEPLVAPGTVVQGDARGSLITLAGTAAEIERAERAIAMFDVDWLRKQSFGLFPLKYSSAKEVADDSTNVLGKQGPLAGLVQVSPIEHLNSILVVSRRLSYVNQVRGWIERFDRGRDVLKPRLFVYPVQNSRARDLAAVLTRVFTQARVTNGASSVGNESAPPTDGIMLSRPTPASSGSETAFATARNIASGASLASAGSPTIAEGGEPTSADAGTRGSGQDDLRITADEINNSLLIVTTPTRYAQVEAALAQLDVVPLQVLLEASIIEVNVTDDFKYGVQAAFQKGSFSALSSSVAASALAPSTGGLSAALIRGNIQATIDLLSTFTKLRVISSPKILVLNNRTASLQVGDQVPIATSSAVSTITSNAPTVNTIQLYDTGIILHATPRVNRSGLVLMDLSQEVSASVPTSSSSLNSPTIQQRRVSTSVAVADGQTIAIGGLIRDSRTNNVTGIPVLKDIPGVGALFGQNGDQVDRTELMVLVTPHVIRSPADADAATDELSSKLLLLQPLHVSRQR